MTYHEPVLLHESVEGLNINPEGIYVDVTFGGGGHSRAILSKLTTGKLLAFDQDPDAVANVPNDPNLIFIPQNFSYLSKFLRFYGYTQIDGLLADLGVSSHQFNTASRGFSFRDDALLDMRMDKKSALTAQHIVNEWEQEALSRIFYNYGELSNARKLAEIICNHRDSQPINTTGDLRLLVEQHLPQKLWHKQLAQIFQALRIEVNQELEVIKQLLEQCQMVIKPGGRLVVIAYHSLEDRLVKNYLRSGNFSGEITKDFFGNPLVPFKSITRKPITPNAIEIKQNNRARSAKLRIGERTALKA